MKVWVLEKVWFDCHGYARSTCHSFLHERRARSAMRDDWHEEYIAHGLHSPPEDDIGPFEGDTDAALALPDGTGGINWRIHETETETEK